MDFDHNSVRKQKPRLVLCRDYDDVLATSRIYFSFTIIDIFFYSGNGNRYRYSCSSSSSSNNNNNNSTDDETTKTPKIIIILTRGRFRIFWRGGSLGQIKGTKKTELLFLNFARPLPPLSLDCLRILDTMSERTKLKFDMSCSTWMSLSTNQESWKDMDQWLPVSIGISWIKESFKFRNIPSSFYRTMHYSA